MLCLQLDGGWFGDYMEGIQGKFAKKIKSVCFAKAQWMIVVTYDNDNGNICLMESKKALNES